MKRPFTLTLKCVFKVLFLFSFSTLSALPVGNPELPSMHYYGVYFARDCYQQTCWDPTPAWWYALSFRLGLYGDHVLDRKMKVKDTSNNSIIENTTLSSSGVSLTLNAFDRYDFFLTLGGGHIFLDTNASAFGESQSRLHIATQNEFAWTFGGRAILWHCNCTTLGLEAAYFQMNPFLKRVTIEDSLSHYPDKKRVKYQEAQIALTLSHRFTYLIPYMALKLSHAKMHFVEADVPTIRFLNLISQRDLGFSLGVSLLSCYRMTITGEVRFFDERAFDLQAQCRF